VTICIIPARGGSKRLPRKNILPLGDGTILGKVITTCINSKVFDEVIVSTEDSEISDLAKAVGADVWLRDTSLATDTATVVDVCLDVLLNKDCSEFCCVYATAALLRAETLKHAAIEFQNSNCDVLMGVSKYNFSPVQALVLGADRNATLFMNEFKGVQSQNYPTFRVSNGTFYWGKKEQFSFERTFYSNCLKVYDVPSSEVCDVDTIEDYNRLVNAHDSLQA
jgi:pseudaminic acid cytidylyltransferase